MSAVHPPADEIVGGDDRGRPARRRRSWTPALWASLAGLALVVPVVTSAGARPQATTLDARLRAQTAAALAGPKPPPAPVCPRSTTPQDGGGYAIAVTATITNITLNNGWNEKLQLWQSIAENISARACGLLHLPSLRVDIAPDGLVFDTSKAHLYSPNHIFNPTDFSVTLAPTGAAVNRITGVQPDGALDLAASTPLLATVLPGSQSGGTFKCPIKANATLTTGQKTQVPVLRGPMGPTQVGADGKTLPPWTVQGTPLTGTGLIGASAEVASDDFALPVFDTDPKLCGASGQLLNIAFGGADAQGVPYDGLLTTNYGPVHPAGTAWAHGLLTITGVDPKAVPVGAPAGSQSSIVPACVPPPGPPFRLGVVGAFTGPGLRVTNGVTISKISGTLCGTATVIAAPQDTHPGATVCTELRAPGVGQQFQSLETTLDIIPGVTSEVAKVSVAPQDLVADVCDDGVDGQININTVVRASAVPELFGTGCLVGPLEAPSTGALSGPLRQATVRLSSAPFAINAVQPSTPACPSGLATNTNQILGLPLTHTTDGLTIDATAGLYLAK